MKTKYINDFIDEYNNVHVYELLCKINELCKFKFYHVANNMINELYEIYCNTQFDNVNNDLFVMMFDDECMMFLLIDKIAKLVRMDYRRKLNYDSILYLLQVFLLCTISRLSISTL